MRRSIPVLWAASIVIGLPVAAADPAVVQSMIDSVDRQTVENHIGALDYERFATEDQNDASAYIAAELSSYGYTVVFDPVSTSENLVVRIPGSVNPDSVFIVGAHFDTVSGSPGADDNASGVAGLLEIARVLHGSEPESTIELIAFGLEEVGKIGSNSYAQTLSLQGKDVLGMVSLDMIAYSCSTFGCQTGTQTIPGCLTAVPEGLSIGTGINVGSNVASAALMNRFTAVSNTFVPELDLATFEVAGTGLCETNTRRSDHASFWDRGFPALIVSDGAENRNPNYHLATDQTLSLDFDLATKVTRTTLAVLIEETFPELIVEPVDVNVAFNQLELQWTQVEGAIGYDVVRGNVKRLTGGNGNYRTSLETCVANDLPDLNFEDPVAVAPGQGKWYLVRAVTPGGGSSYDTGTEVVSRDSGINSSPGTCP